MRAKETFKTRRFAGCSGRALAWAFAVSALLLVVFVAGPRVEIDPTLRPADIPPRERLDEFIASRESRFTDLVPGTEATIIWHHEDRRETRFAIVYIHGFSASRQECAPVSELLAERLEANLFSTRLTAHGRGPEPFATVTVNDWLNDAYEAVQIGKQLGQRVIVIGMSTGATLGLWAAHHEPAVAATVLLSPNFGPANHNAEFALYPWGNLIVRVAQGKYAGFQPRNELHARYWTPRYRSEGLLAMMGVVDLCRRTDFHDFNRPCLFVYSEQDQIVDVERIKTAFAAVGSPAKQLVALENSPGHMLAGDILSPSTTEPLVDHLHRFLIKQGDQPAK